MFWAQILILNPKPRTSPQNPDFDRICPVTQGGLARLRIGSLGFRVYKSIPQFNPNFDTLNMCWGAILSAFPFPKSSPELETPTSLTPLKRIILDNPGGSIYKTIREFGSKIPCNRRNYASQFPNGCIFGPSDNGSASLAGPRS